MIKVFVRFRPIPLVLGFLALAVSSTATDASAVQRMYAGQLRLGVGDAGPTLDPIQTFSGTGTEPIDTHNNAIPACAAPGATITSGGLGTNPAATSMGAGPNTATLVFFGLADVATTASGAIDPAQPIQFLAVAPTPASANVWGLTTVCPSFPRVVPGGLIARSTPMAQFSWPASTGSVGPGMGAVPALTIGGAISPASLVISSPLVSRQRMGVVAGPNRYGGSVGLIGTANILIGHQGASVPEISTLVLSVPFPLAIGRNGGGGATPSGMSGVIPTLVTTSADPYVGRASLPAHLQPGGPIPPPVPFPGGLGFFPPFGSAAALAWTTGIVTAFDSRGRFRTTRTRTGASLDVVGPFPAVTTARLQLVSPSVVHRGSGFPPSFTLLNFSQAASAELEIRFVPESPIRGGLVGGFGLMGGALGVRRRRARNRARP